MLITKLPLTSGLMMLNTTITNQSPAMSMLPYRAPPIIMTPSLTSIAMIHFLWMTTYTPYTSLNSWPMVPLGSTLQVLSTTTICVPTLLGKVLILSKLLSRTPPNTDSCQLQATVTYSSATDLPILAPTFLVSTTV